MPLNEKTEQMFMPNRQSSKNAMPQNL